MSDKKRAGIVAIAGAAVITACYILLPGTTSEGTVSTSPAPTTSRTTEATPTENDPTPSSSAPVPSEPAVSSAPPVEPVNTPTSAPTPPAPSTPPPASAPNAVAGPDWNAMGFSATESTYGTSKYPKVQVLAAPNVSSPEVVVLDSPTKLGSPLTFLVKRDTGDFLEVYLPTRPNGAVGFIRKGDVDLSKNAYRVESSTASFTTKVYKDGAEILSLPMAIGKNATPTPKGLFYITERNYLSPATSSYGSAAIGLSGHSEVLTAFGIGDGDVGMHGTSKDSSIGTKASHGCMRFYNNDIKHLVDILPWGTPVYVS